MTHKHLIIYHANCDDGFGAAWAAATSPLLMGQVVELYPASYGDAVPWDKIDENTEVHILDFSYPPATMEDISNCAHLVYWLDHHKSAIDAWYSYVGGYEEKPEWVENMYVVLDMTKSGAMIAWDYYHTDGGREAPVLIQYIQDRDLWKKELPYCDNFHLNLSTYEKTIDEWNRIAAEVETDEGMHHFVREGYAIKRFYDQCVEQAMDNSHAVIIKLGSELEDSLYIHGVNCSGKFASDVGNKLANECPECIGFTYEILEQGYIKCSIRSVGDVDVAYLAKQFGGGGHKNAAGFILQGKDAESLLMYGELRKLQ